MGLVIYPPQPITFRQYMEEAQVKRRYDIVNGVRVFAVPPSLRHQDIVGNFLLPLHDYAGQHDYAILFSLFDVLISWEPSSVAPELVVEIIPTIDRELALDGKMRDYYTIGVRECWIIDPEQQTVEVRMLVDGGSEVFSSGTAAVSQIFDGLSVSVDAIFEE